MILTGVEILSDDNRSVVIFEERRGIIYKGINSSKKKVVRYRVDNDDMAVILKRCDYAMELPAQKSLYLIELKGEDLRKAASQILSTLDHFKTVLEQYKIHARVVCSRTPRPDLVSTQVVKLKKTVAISGGDFKSASGRLEEGI